jgi:hypothetical protein
MLEGGRKKLIPQNPEISRAALVVDISVVSGEAPLMHGKNTEDVEIAVIIPFVAAGVINVSLMPCVFVGSNQFANVNSFVKLDSNGLGAILLSKYIFVLKFNVLYVSRIKLPELDPKYNDHCVGDEIFGAG